MAAGVTVSVIIPYYMQRRYIRETVLSAANQQGARMEVIVIDDESPDPAAPWLEGIEGIKLLRTENQGCAATRNYGFRQSTGSYVIFLDGDDVLQPGAVVAHLKALSRDTKAALSFGGYRVIDEDGRELKPAYICKRRKNFRRMMFETNPMPSPGVTMIRREAFNEAGGFDLTLSAQVDDYDFYLRLIQRHPFTRHDLCVLNYRQHSSNISNDRSKMQQGTLEVLDRIEAGGNLSAAERRRLKYSRGRWIHHYNPEPTLRYRLQHLYYRFRTMLTLPPNLWFG